MNRQRAKTERPAAREGLFDFACDSMLAEDPPAQRHSVTSKAAAQAITGVSQRLRDRVYQFIDSKGLYGATDEEIQIALDMNPNTQRPRRCELLERGQIAKIRGLTRKTSSGRAAQVWVTTGEQC